MAEGLTQLTRAQLATIGKYANVQFIWAPTQSSDLIFSVPYTDVDGTGKVHNVVYINLAFLFEATEGGAEDVGPGSATRVATETHDGALGALAALTAAQAQALKVPNVIFVDADPLGGTDLMWTLADEPRAWVIDFTALFDAAAGELQSHVTGAWTTGNGGEITRAQLAGVNRLTINWVNSGPDTALLYTVEGSRNTYIINLSQLMYDGTNTADQIAAASHTHP